MIRRVPAVVVLLGLVSTLAPVVGAQVDSGTIRIRPSTEGTAAGDAPASPGAEPSTTGDDARRAFDYDAFETKLLGLWFQRKIHLAQGRDADVAQQSDAIRSFCAAEGIGRLRGLADALLVEARHSIDQGHYRRATDALDLAEDLDPGRSQIRFARAVLTWKSGGGIVDSSIDALAGVRASLVERIGDFSLLNPFGFVVVIAAMGAVLVFALLMVGRYHVPFRHEIEEWCVRRGWAGWARPLGWLVLLLPLVVWVGAGWAVLFWIAALFPFLRRRERAAAVVLVGLVVVAVPVYRLSVGVFGMTTDPVVRTTLDAARAPYNPDRIVKLRELLDAHPDDATLHFLLAGLYANGRYYDEAFSEYRRALEIEPSLHQAHINIGNLYHRTGQYNEAIANYLRALEEQPRSVLAYYNLHLAQSESFRFREASESLDRARSVDAEGLSLLMARHPEDETRAGVIDAQVDLGSVWSAALEGGRVQQRLRQGESGPSVLATLPAQFVNPVTFVASVALVAGFALAGVFGSAGVARRCIRCGRAFCQRCKSSREGHEYCSQCLHLFVLGDGLAPETKSRKLYEVERHERRTRFALRAASVVVPGTAQVLRGRVLYGLVLCGAWLAALIAWQPRLLRPVERWLGFDLRLDLLGAGDVPATFAVDPWAFFGLAIAVAVWLAANVTAGRRREA